MRGRRIRAAARESEEQGVRVWEEVRVKGTVFVRSVLLLNLLGICNTHLDISRFAFTLKSSVEKEAFDPHVRN